MHGFQGRFPTLTAAVFLTAMAQILGTRFFDSITSLIYFDKAGRHGPCDFDLRQNLVANFLYNVPGPKLNSALRYFATGWQVGGIVTASTGVPFTIITGGDPLGQNSSDQIDFPNRVSGCSPVNNNFKSLAAPFYLNQGCFFGALLRRPGLSSVTMGEINYMAPGWSTSISPSSRTPTFRESRSPLTCSYDLNSSTCSIIQISRRPPISIRWDRAWVCSTQQRQRPGRSNLERK